MPFPLLHLLLIFSLMETRIRFLSLLALTWPRHWDTNILCLCCMKHLWRWVVPFPYLGPEIEMKAAVRTTALYLETEAEAKMIE